ncbi:DUF1992 domain-containing protein [Paenibacillus arenosi]|uniref:DUF1992 domain-containing protein n=1 Tax=Paenibacillus arenosi TaxID=2774142 RepID=A0ABR9B3V7_9BACL|nr:DUF1992 domain-containing protein [Paenibacillus arenosi]MBD8501030.1 DUF1992 domain-containing protein [Paenibacillus arenosi]
MSLYRGDFMDDIVGNYEKSGKMSDLHGKGKPIQPSSGDPLQGVLKEANYLPGWLEQQQLIRKGILEAITLLEVTGDSPSNMQICLNKLNADIAQYNKSCPPIMQRGFITVENIHTKLEQWS